MRLRTRYVSFVSDQNLVCLPVLTRRASDSVQGCTFTASPRRALRPKHDRAIPTDLCVFGRGTFLLYPDQNRVLISMLDWTALPRTTFPSVSCPPLRLSTFSAHLLKRSSISIEHVCLCRNPCNMVNRSERDIVLYLVEQTQCSVSSVTMTVPR